MSRSFLKDESGMTMGLAVIMIVLVGVMGAGLLTFVSRDLNAVVEVNQGQKAFDIADAGISAAKAQLTVDPDPARYDGGELITPDNQWSMAKGGQNLNMGGSSANVRIEANQPSSGYYRVTSTGMAGDAKRKVEAIYEFGIGVSTPRAYFTRGNFLLTGSARPSGVSFFAMGEARKEGASSSLGSQDDTYFGKWATTTDRYSYPNNFNRTARTDPKAGVAALGTVTGFPDTNTRAFGSNTTIRTVSTYGSTDDPNKIAFPFLIPTEAEDKRSVDRLRKRALELEQIALDAGNAVGSAATRYYIDSVPGNGIDDPGLSNGALNVANWPDPSDYQTVRFYKYQTYNNANLVNYGNSATLSTRCSTSGSGVSGIQRGIIVVQNGNFSMNGNKSFYGGIVVRAYDSTDPTGTRLLQPSAFTSPYEAASNYQNGGFLGEGDPCLRGYVNASGNMKFSGDIQPGDVPDLGGQPAFSAGMRTLSWRELYE